MATKEEIKDSAYYCFAHYGYEGTTMQDIAKAVGLKKQSLYSHFESKEELFLTVLQEQSRIITAELDMVFNRLKDKPVEDLLKGVFGGVINTFSVRERLLLWKRTFIYFSSAETKEIKEPSDWHFDRKLSESLEHAILDSNVGFTGVYRAFFLSFMLTIQGYLDWMLVMGHSEDTWAAIWRNYWNGASANFLN